ncbi:MAG: MarR family transcriptional regulator [Candidatus Bathyarchaeota archaeon]|nr:MarR family transcriptional regulator [Candidatus Bathyarchaeota archaeon]
MIASDLEKQISRIPLVTKIINTESCLLIYSYFTLYGKTTPVELRQRINLSKATVFRSLALLTEAGIVTKEINDQIADKRFSIEYYISETLEEFSKVTVSKEIKKYAKTQGKLRILEDWLSQLEFLPLVLNRLTSQLMISVCDDPSSQKREKKQIIKTLVFRLKEEENYAEFQEKLKNFMREIDAKHSKRKRNMKQPMKNPVAFSISVVAFSDDLETICEDSVVIKKRTEL